MNAGNPKAQQSPDFETTLIVSLFGVGYSLMFKVFQGETTFANLIRSEYLVQLVVTLMLNLGNGHLGI